MLHLGQAIDAQSRGDDNQTLVELDKALDTGLDHPAVHFILGHIYTKKGSRNSLKHLQSAVLHPDFSLGAYLLMGQYYFKQSDFHPSAVAYLHAMANADSLTVPPAKAEELRQLYEPIIEAQSHQQDENELKKLCQNIEGQLNRPDWLNQLKSLRKQLPESQDSSLQPLADLLLSSSGYVVEAMTKIRELAARQYYYTATEEAFFILDKAPTFLPLHILIGELLLQQDKTQEAVNKFVLVANLYNLRGEANQGIRMLERVTKMAPMNLKIRNQLVDILINQGQVVPAVEQLKQMADIYYQLAELDKARQTYSNAIRLIQQSRTHRSILLDLLYRKADIDLQHLDFRQAIRGYEQIRTIEPQDNKARIRLIDLYFRLSQDSTAINELDTYIKLLEDSSKRQNILQFLQELVSEVPDKLEIRKRLADQYLKQGKKTESIEQLDVIADALLNMGNRDAALRVLKTIIALKPDNINEYQQAYLQLNQK
jgi:tetratricopeptide (TPR) repeat protein